MRAINAGLLLTLAACASVPTGSVAQGLPSASPAIRVERAWIHAAPAGQFETWAFATIVNPGKADTLVEVRTPDAGSVVLRAATLTDAGRKMRSVVGIPVPAQGELTLSVDSYFIAFIEARHAFVAGQAVTATLRFASGAEAPATFKVSETEGDPADRGN
jgi:copper(I)-binding protein